MRRCLALAERSQVLVLLVRLDVLVLIGLVLLAVGLRGCMLQ